MKAMKPATVEVNTENIKLNDIVGYYNEENKGVCLGNVTDINTDTFKILCGNTEYIINKDRIIIHYPR